MAEAEGSLRALYALRAPVAGHVGEDEWLALAGGIASPAARDQALEHVVRCTGCASIYRGLSELEEGARAFDAGVPAALAPARLGVFETARWGWLGGLAAAAAVVWVVAQPRSGLAPAPTPSAAEMRGGASARPALVEPLGPVSVWPARLRWQPVADSNGYRARILDGEGNEVWSSAIVAETSIAWPAQVAPRPGRVYWQVTAYPRGLSEADGVASILASFDYRP